MLQLDLNRVLLRSNIRYIIIIYTDHRRPDYCETIDDQLLAKFDHKKCRLFSRDMFGTLWRCSPQRKANLCAYWQGAGTLTVPVQL